MIDVKSFGAVGDGIADDTVAIQAAIDAAMLTPGTNKPKVLLSTGVYKISNTLQIGDGSTFRSAHIEGEGQKYRGSGNTFCGTGIVATFKDRPVFAINGARRTTIRHLTIVGLNGAWIDAAQLMGANPTVDDLNSVNWVDPTFPLSASSQFAPYCAIAIDPCCGIAPSVCYPFNYGKQHSSGVVIDDVEISGFVVGVMINPSQEDGNGDFTKILNCKIEKCQYGISIGHSQSRLVSIENSDLATLYCGIATTKHGLQNGKPSINVRATQIAKSVKWMDIPNTSYGGGPSFRDCYGEGVYTLGNLGLVPASSHFPTLFDGCEFHFIQFNNRPEPLYWLDASGEGQVTFRNCSFSRAGTRPNVWAFGGNPAAFRFENTYFDAGGNAVTAAQKRAFNGCNGVVVGKYGEHKFSHASIRTSSCFDPVTLAKTGPNQFNDDFSIKTYGTSIHAKRIAPTLFDVGSIINIPKYLIKKQKAVISGGKILTVDLSLAGQTEALLIANGGDAGDILVDQETGVVFFVEDRNGLILTLSAQNGYNQDGTLITPITNAYFFWASNCRVP